MEEQLKNIREILGEILAWASGNGMDCATSIRLYAKLYSELVESGDSVEQ